MIREERSSGKDEKKAGCWVYLALCWWMLTHGTWKVLADIQTSSVSPVQISRDGSLNKLLTLPSLHSCCTKELILHTMTLAVPSINPLKKKKNSKLIPLSYYRPKNKWLPCKAASRAAPMKPASYEIILFSQLKCFLLCLSLWPWLVIIINISCNIVHVTCHVFWFWVQESLSVPFSFPYIHEELSYSA